MVVLSDKTDYGSFAEPSSSGILVVGGPGGTVSHHISGSSHSIPSIRANSHSSNSNTNSNSNSLNSVISVGGVGNTAGGVAGGGGALSHVGENNNSIIIGNSGGGGGNNSGGGGGGVSDSSGSVTVNPNVHLGLGLELGLSLAAGLSPTQSVSSAAGESQGGGREGGKVRSSCRERPDSNTTSGNSLTISGGHHHNHHPHLRHTSSNVNVNNNNNHNTQNYSASSSPMSTNSGDLLYQRQPLLQECENGEWADPDGGLEISSESSELKRNRGAMVRIPIDVPGLLRTDSEESVVSLKRYPKEKKKTLLAFVLLCLNFILATVSLSLTHDRVPDRKVYPPLPDVFLDRLNAQDWALDVSEILIMVSTGACFIVMILHKHRWIVFRRTFLILSVLYLMRSLTMYVTVLPVASFTYTCSPKSNSTSVLMVAKRVIQLVSGFGLSINGQHTFCGDYMYSGHTVILVTAYLIIQEYTPRKLVLVHWASWLASLTGIVMVLIARGHYTIDVLVAYYVTTRIFWIYHTLAHNPHLKNNPSSNYLSRIWWFPVFTYMEGNVGGALPRRYSYPWSSKPHRSRRNI